jgi:hypothetical protein
VCRRNPNTKVQLNYLLERRDQPGTDPAWINGVGVRDAYDFEFPGTGIKAMRFQIRFNFALISGM